MYLSYALFETLFEMIMTLMTMMTPFGFLQMCYLKWQVGNWLNIPMIVLK